MSHVNALLMHTDPDVQLVLTNQDCHPLLKYHINHHIGFKPTRTCQSFAVYYLTFDGFYPLAESTLGKNWSYQLEG